MVISTIEGHRPRLRPSERVVADFVLGRPSVIIHMSIADFAEGAGVSEPTIMRFCKALGCVGFMEFKLALARDLERRTLSMTSDRSMATEKPSATQASGLGSSLMAHVLAHLETAALALPLNALEDVLTWCAVSRHILILHDGSEGELADHLLASFRASGSANPAQRVTVCAGQAAAQPALSEASVVLALRSCGLWAPNLVAQSARAGQSHKWVSVGIDAPWADAALATATGTAGIPDALLYLCLCACLCQGVQGQMAYSGRLDGRSARASNLLQSRREIAYGDARRKNRQAAGLRQQGVRAAVRKDKA